ncbi:hypothetical protein MVEN_02204600 [Mycena venus]|uniref:Uncharacterized protein n=1 Tax=Mycena venus TaxID=2733690 RepID=A0A8H6X6L9_9AGAR|nr:hypothetical protein MVEN_02204600 [Mycena venus]
MFPNALEQKWGTKAFLERIQAAAHGKYTPRNYSEYEIDLSIMLYELGGGGAVHAMHQSIFALPSLNTLQPHRRQQKTKPCIDRVYLLTISENITTMFGSHEPRGVGSNGSPGICGHNLSFDEIAIERRIEYMPTTDQMAGFCLQHVDALERITVGKDTQAVEAAVEAVKSGRVHIAHETTVGAISHLSGRDYGAKPVFMAPTCKKGSWRDMLESMQAVLEAWRHSPDGEAKHGPILSVCSDGDPGRRDALFMLCMHSEILPGNPLYPFICNLPGFNRRVGHNNVGMDMDYRHEIKRLRALLCSSAGMLAKDVWVNRDLLTSWLERLPNHDWSETTIHTLLDPKDTMNVGQAIKLLLCIAEMRELDVDDFDPSEAAEFEALCLLGEVFDALLQPFINPDFSLSQQIKSLVNFYGDLQATVKAAILMVAKTLDINPRLAVYLCLLGDDPAATFLIAPLPNSGFRFCSAMNLDRVYDLHPELERKPVRLKLVRTRDLDHLRPTQWRGDLVAENCRDIDIHYTAGVEEAEGILRKYSVTDLLRPFGGKYPGISTEIDRSMVNIPTTRATDVDLEIVGRAGSINPICEFDFDSRMAADKSRRDIASHDPHSVFATISSGGQLCHKKAIVRTFFDTPDAHSTHDRLQRVRGFTLGGKSWEREEPLAGGETISPSTHFQLGNLFTTFICYNGTHLGLAVAKSTLIKRGPPGSKSPSISAVPLAELSLSSSPYTFSVSSRLIDPITQKGRREALIFDLEKTNDSTGINFTSEREKTWIFDNTALLNSWYTVKNRVIGDPTLHDKIPVFSGTNDGIFPYQVGLSESFQGTVYAYSIVGTPIADVIANRQTCRICGKRVKDTDRQTHMGQHIRRALRGVPEDSVKIPVQCSDPLASLSF